MRKTIYLIVAIVSMSTGFSQTAKDYVIRGNTKSLNEDFLGAIAEYNKAIQIDPNSAEAFHLRGGCKSDLGDQRGAIVDFSMAIKINSNQPMPYINRGMSKIILNQKESACLDFSKAGELGMSYAYDLIKSYCN